MPCPAADELPHDRAVEIADRLAGGLRAVLPGHASYTWRRDAYGREVLLVETSPFEVDVAAPEPLRVTLAIDPGPCLAIARIGEIRRHPVTRVDSVRITVRVGDEVAATHQLGRTHVESFSPLLVVRDAGGLLGFDLYGEGDETLRTLVEVPELRGWAAAAPELATDLGSAAPGAAQERAAGRGDPALRGAWLVAGPGVAGSRVWVDGIPLGELSGAVEAPVGNIVSLRWEGVSEGGVDAALGPGVTLELRADGTARILDRPDGQACAVNDGDALLRVCRAHTWSPGDTLPIAPNACGPDGSLVVGASGHLRTVLPGLPGTYRFRGGALRAPSVTWSPDEQRCVAVALWDRAYETGTVFPGDGRFDGWLAPLNEATLHQPEDRPALWFDAPETIVLPGTDLAVTLGEAPVYAEEIFGGVRLAGPMRLSAPGMTGELALWPGILDAGEESASLLATAYPELAVAWASDLTLCDGTVVSGGPADFSAGSQPLGFRATGEASMVEGPHVLRSMGYDRRARELWFEVAPAPGWPLPISGLPDPIWADLSALAEPRLVRCPVGAQGAG
jgi:hypothetical protein